MIYKYRMSKYSNLLKDLPQIWQDILNVKSLDLILDNVLAEPKLTPKPELIFNAFKFIKTFDELKVIIIGQDPYIQEGQAMGLSFSVPPRFKIPDSLVNIYKAINKYYPQTVINGDLTPWAKQGVLLLNSALTTIIGSSNSHAKIWAKYTDYIILEICKRTTSFAMILWGNFAHKKAELVPKNVLILKWRHPSPLGDNKAQPEEKFENCTNFIDVNMWLSKNNRSEINWSLGNLEHYHIVIFTDGAASANGTARCKAAWGVYIPAAPFCLEDGITDNLIGYIEEIKLSGKVVNTDGQLATNNRAEFGGIYAALSWAIVNSLQKNKITIVSDSGYCINTLNIWASNWIKEDKLNEKKNVDLITCILKLMELFNSLRFIHMRGHKKDLNVPNSFIKGNDMADMLASSSV